MTFYLKYRPQTIEDLDITSVRESLGKVVKSGEIPHAFLFAGSKGTGKTSTARILAKIINCEDRKGEEPCNDCDSCKSISNGSNIDVIEMDAASNRGIDDIRALRDIVKLAPANSIAKVYIIDEAHMLTTEASNALLKTLEEPPAHVYFILATTNPEKLIDTIRSRTTIINFTKATPEETKRSVQRIVKSEKIKIEDSEVDKIIKLSKGSFRDAVKLLEQYSKDPSFLSSQNNFDVDRIIDLLSKKNKSEILEQIAISIKNGLGVDNITSDILEALQKQLLADFKSQTLFDKHDLILLIELILTSQEFLKVTPIEELPLQLAIVKWCENSTADPSNSSGETKKNIQKETVATSKEEVKKKAEKLENEPEVNNVEAKETLDNNSSNEKVTVVSIDNLPEIDKNSWEKVLTEIRPINASIEGLLRSSKPLGFDGKKLKLSVYYKFHKDKLEEAKNKKILEEAMEKVFQNQVKIECMLTDQPITPNIPKNVLTEVKNDNILTVAEGIFG